MYVDQHSKWRTSIPFLFGCPVYTSIRVGHASLFERACSVSDVVMPTAKQTLLAVLIVVVFFLGVVS